MISKWHDRPVLQWTFLLEAAKCRQVDCQCDPSENGMVSLKVDREEMEVTYSHSSVGSSVVDAERFVCLFAVFFRLQCRTVE